MTSFIASDTQSGMSAYRSSYGELPSGLYIPGIEGVKRNVTVIRSAEAAAGARPSAPSVPSIPAHNYTDVAHGGKPRAKLGPIIRGGDENDAALFRVSDALRAYAQDVKLMSFAYVHQPLRRFKNMHADSWFVTGVPEGTELTSAQRPALNPSAGGGPTETDAVAKLFYLLSNANAHNELIAHVLPTALTFGLARDGTWRVRDGVYTSFLNMLLDELPTLEIDTVAIAPPASGYTATSRGRKAGADEDDEDETPIHILDDAHIIVHTAPLAVQDSLPLDSELLHRVVAAGFAKETGFSMPGMQCWLLGEAGVDMLPGEGAPGAPVPPSASQPVPTPLLLSKHHGSKTWFVAPTTAPGAVLCRNLAYLLAMETPAVFTKVTGMSAAELTARAADV